MDAAELLDRLLEHFDRKLTWRYVEDTSVSHVDARLADDLTQWLTARETSQVPE